ncbi:MAG: DegT/DnrJ/EryC1/StrS family aminotransferase [Coriobacteriales bacterium]|jgi:dTDP-4-amino-4,6-dideoxygalactose transaminase|nr:DegT/DnrJ/EryC1/StrS family aminotransferase [Coriobacteriales bacterium]
MQFIDLRTQFERIEDDVRARIDAVLQSQQFIMGPPVIELEERLAAFAGVRHALSCSSGTDALVIALMALGLEKDDAVFVPAFTFFASAESVTLAGGTPVFVDVDPVTFNLSPSSLGRAVDDTLAAGRLRPRGIMPVDLFGQPADYRAIEEVARAHGLFVIEDAAQGFGGSYHGRTAGSFGTVAATSFFPAKPLGCYGDGGAIFTDDDDLAALIASVRVHGQGADKYDNVRIGLNGRLDSLQAAVLLSKLDLFEQEIAERNRIAAAYTHELEGLLVTPTVPDGLVSTWAQYTLLAKDADERSRILAALKDKGVPTAVYYTTPLHLSTAYAALGYHEGDLPVCEDLSRRAFSLPMHPYLSETDLVLITQTIRECL